MLAIDSIAKLPPMNMAPLLRDRANAAIGRARRSAHDRAFAVPLFSRIIVRLNRRGWVADAKELPSQPKGTRRRPTMTAPPKRCPIPYLVRARSR